MRNIFREPRWLLLSPLLIAACTLSLLRSPLPVATPPEVDETSSSPRFTQAVPDGSATTAPDPGRTSAAPGPTPGARFCDDPRPRALIEQFKTAVNTADGALLASLVSPQHGMDARLLRHGRVVNYDPQHAAALFDSTYVVDWGLDPGSGLPIKGSFQERVLPDIIDVLSRQVSTECNRIQLGGATYTPTWPYDGIDFYSLYYAGSPEYGGLDWHTWVIGMHFVGDRPYLYAIMQFKWEP